MTFQENDPPNPALFFSVPNTDDSPPPYKQIVTPWIAPAAVEVHHNTITEKI